jgi:hypothetical protein
MTLKRLSLAVGVVATVGLSFYGAEDNGLLKQQASPTSSLSEIAGNNNFSSRSQKSGIILDVFGKKKESKPKKQDV